MIQSVIIVLIAYLLGSIPFGLILTKLMGAGDIRKIGSGNIGATNVLRTGNKKLAALTLLLDLLKGTLAASLALLWAPEYASYAAFAAILGHVFPVWLKLRGGKGVATALGVFVALSPSVALAAMLSWMAVVFLIRISSASALIAIAYTPLWLIVFHQEQYLWLCGAVILLIFFTHKDNIRRLITGTEPQICEMKKDE
ncbi:MAG: glycerol-3-phosphate 1-O-acyltransferase PlsY [Alphaproteobacteria bacterium]|nr:glycerol-3-phosphate 1-O-acyltransferase PlsY [Alphaproteobacteria bacterium]